MMLPKSVEGKIERLNSALERAYMLRHEIEDWAEKNGLDTSSNEWYERASDDCSAVSGISKEGILSLLEEKECEKEM